MSSSNEETTTVVSRRIKPGHEREYADWFSRVTEAIKRAPGFRGVTVIIPEDSQSRIILYRFADTASMENWEDSPQRKALMSEVGHYATQKYDSQSGVQTFFHVDDSGSA